MKDKVKMFRGKYGFLSNMFEAEFEWDGRKYSCSEAAYQSAKSKDSKVRDAFSQMNGVTAKREGKTVALRGDWEGVKLELMEEIVRAKFTQNPELLKMLIDTGDMELIEGNRWHDKYWGVDLFTGEGENHLGMILMKVRAELGGADLGEQIARMQAEREEEKRREEEEKKSKIDEIKAEMAALPEYEFVGMEFGTRAFGRVKIIRREGDYLFFAARGAEKKFALPGCVVNGFLIPDDASVVENYKKRLELAEELKKIQ